MKRRDFFKWIAAVLACLGVKPKPDPFNEIRKKMEAEGPPTTINGKPIIECINWKTGRLEY